VEQRQKKAENKRRYIRIFLKMRSRALNLKHLRYFAEVARRGSVTAAAKALFVAPQTVSAQIQELADSVGQPLFERVGRRLVLTAAGQTALDYANTIFALGDELGAVLRDSARARTTRLRIGVTDSVPKLLTVALLEPVLDRHRKEVELFCREGAYGELLGRLAAGEIDAVLADTAVPSNLARSLQASVLADSGMTFLAAPTLVKELGQEFPRCLDGAPFLAGSPPSSLLGQALGAWFARHGLRPHVVGRVEDSALLVGFAQRGLGVVAAPTSIERDVMERYGLEPLGRTSELRQSVFLIRARGRRPNALVAELEPSRPDATSHTRVARARVPSEADV
jgi:LysR family transcriptional activator of nhaA